MASPKFLSLRITLPSWFPAKKEDPVAPGSITGIHLRFSDGDRLFGRTIEVGPLPPPPGRLVGFGLVTREGSCGVQSLPVDDVLAVDLGGDGPVAVSDMTLVQARDAVVKLSAMLESNNADHRKSVKILVDKIERLSDESGVSAVLEQMRASMRRSRIAASVAGVCSLVAFLLGIEAVLSSWRLMHHG